MVQSQSNGNNGLATHILINQCNAQCDCFSILRRRAFNASQAIICSNSLTEYKHIPVSCYLFLMVDCSRAVIVEL